MRIERLALERYGHFTDREIDLGGENVRLHVLLGANEAGKTTALNALGDLLFGISATSPFNFRHDYKDMRIGAELLSSAGRRLRVRRRKGNKNTLLGADDRPLADGALAPFLGNASRFVFDNLFGLTHASLRAGGEEMLAAGGELGRMLFSAGSSMPNAIGVLNALEADASALFTPRRAHKKPFYVADDRRIEAEREVRRLSLSAEAWRRNETERREVEASLAGVRSRLGELEARRARLERIRRTLPRLGELREAEPELAALADAPALPADAGERAEAALRTLAVATSRIEREATAAAAARTALAELEIPPALLAAGEEIGRLFERRGAILDGRSALPALRSRHDELQAGLARLRSELRLELAEAGDPAGASAIPAEPDLAAVRALIAADVALGKRIDDVRERRDAAAAELAAIAADLSAIAPPPDLTRLGLAVKQAQGLGDIDAATDSARRNAADASARLANELAALPLWSGDADALDALAVPAADTVLRFERELGEAQTLALRARDRLDAARDEERDCARTLSELCQAGPLPTTEAVVEARRHRDRGWSLIRAVFIAGEPVDEADIEAFAPRPRLAERFEQAIATADDLADRREAEAARLARHAQLASAREAAGDACGRLDVERQRTQEAVDTLLDEWRALWQAIGLTPLPPREMTTWLARRDAVLKTRDGTEAAARALCEGEDRLARARADLLAALHSADPRPRPGGPFSALLKEAQALVENRAAARHRRELLDEKRESQHAIVEREQCRLDALGKEREAWAADWRTALAAIGLPATAKTAAAAAALDIWDAIRRDAAELDGVSRRIGALEADAARFAGALEELIARVVPGLNAKDPLVAAELTFERLQAAKSDAKKKLDLETRLGEADAAAQRARVDESEARGELDALRALAGCAGDDGLAAAIARARRKETLARTVAELKRAIVGEADGLSLHDAIAEAEGVDPDLVQSEIAAGRHDIAALFAETEALSERVHLLRDEGAGMEASRAAAEAEQARRNALADLEECSERWMVTRTAAFLLRRGIERFRQEQQGPLLARAENLFSALTLGAFARFAIDYDSADQPHLLGVRADGTACPVDGMSDGTRDQLYLALRLAAVERYLDAAEPLPFVADDLFVHFDDTRAAAGLEALVALGEKTQVLLFTHHRHLADLAQRAGGGPDRVRVQVIERAERRPI